MSVSYTIDVIARLLRDLHPTADAATVRTLATVAGDTYLEHVDEVPPAERRDLLLTVLEEIAREL